MNRIEIKTWRLIAEMHRVGFSSRDIPRAHRVLSIVSMASRADISPLPAQNATE